MRKTYAEPGRFVVREIAGESLILTVDDARTIRAFYNVCRHRGTRLCTDEAGVFKGTIQCPYHAWTYGLDGTLRVARNMEGVEDFDRADFPLREASVAQFEGFVFVALEPKEPFGDAFSTLAGRFAAWHLPKLRRAASITYDAACNWKLVFQNYSECYHCPVIHPQLERLSPSESGRNDLIEGPFLGGYSELRESAATLTVSGKTQRPLLAGEANRSRVYYYTIFPSMLLGLHPDYVMVHYVQPLAPAQTRITCEWLFDPQTMAAAGLRSLRCGRVLGSDQPPRLGGQRIDPARCCFPRLHSRPVLAARRFTRRVRPLLLADHALDGGWP